MKNIKIAATIVLYNPNSNYKKIIKEIEDLVQYIYIVDNSDNSKKNIIEENKKVKYIKNCCNLGIAHALNQGATEAIKNNCKWLLTMDQDSKMTKEILDELIKYIKINDTSKIGIVSPYHDIKSIENYPSKKEEEMMEVMTSGNLLNLELYQEIGGFKDWLFIDGVDIEYGMNLNQNGYKVIRLNYVKMVHNLGDIKIHNIFNRKIICSNHSAIRRYYMIRNNLYINDLYKDIYPDYCKMLINVQKGQIKRVLFLEKDKFNKIKKMIKGYIDYKKKITGKIKE